MHPVICYGQPFFFLCLSFKQHNVYENPTGIPADDDKGSVEGRHVECSPIVMINAAMANSQSISKISRLFGMETLSRLFFFTQDIILKNVTAVDSRGSNNSLMASTNVGFIY